MAEDRSMLRLISQRSDIVLALGVVAILAVLIIPIPTPLLDFALAFNITFSLIVLLTTLYVRKPLDLSVFPSMLLILTLLRLALNVASTRMILGQGYAGEVINSFGNFVVQGNYVVGMIVFVILVIIQFVVITKGAGRISEVAARFTLDAMPGKQMAIDADLNAGLINETEARRRREEISQEADFYGAMDGASKFVRGDAIAGILIVIINVFGGFIIGMAMNDMPMMEALKTYTLLSIGDGLVTQIPALLISTASGIIVTRAASSANMGSDMAHQLTRQPRAIMIAGGMLLVFGLLPGMPTLTFMLIGGAVSGIGFLTKDARAKRLIEQERVEKQKDTGKRPAEPRTEDLLKIDQLSLEIGYGLLPLVDINQGGDLLNRITQIRKSIASELGIVMPPVRIRDNVRLKPNEYQIKVKGIRVGGSELMLDHIMAINPGFLNDRLDGFETHEPAFKLNATWILPKLRDIAEAKGFTVVEPSAVVATHMTELVRVYSPELVSRQDVQKLVDTLKEDYPALVDSIIPDTVPLGVLQKVLHALLRERIGIRDLATVVETIADYIGATKEPDVLSEYVRMSLKRQITDMYKDASGKIHVFTVDPGVEQTLAESIQNTKQGLVLALDPQISDKLLVSIGTQIKKMHTRQETPICICSPNIRLVLKRLVEPTYPGLIVISYNEILPDTELISSGMVGIHDDH